MKTYLAIMVRDRTGQTYQKKSLSIGFAILLLSGVVLIGGSLGWCLGSGTLSINHRVACTAAETVIFEQTKNKNGTPNGWRVKE